MRKICFSLGFFLFAFQILNAQEQPCSKYEPKDFTIRDSFISPIFPGCESFKESNIELDRCFGKEMAKLIAHKMKMSIDSEIDSINSEVFITKVRIDINDAGKLDMKLAQRIYSEFENRLVLKLDEISNEVTGIIPAKIENIYCTRYHYQLPLKFHLPD